MTSTPTLSSALYSLAAEMRREDGRTTMDPAIVEAAAVRLDEQAVAMTSPTKDLLFEHEDGRYAVNPDTTGDPKWHRLGPVEVFLTPPAVTAKSEGAAT